MDCIHVADGAVAASDEPSEADRPSRVIPNPPRFDTSERVKCGQERKSSLTLVCRKRVRHALFTFRCAYKLIVTIKGSP